MMTTATQPEQQAAVMAKLAERGIDEPDIALMYVADALCLIYFTGSVNAGLKQRLSGVFPSYPHVCVRENCALLTRLPVG